MKRLIVGVKAANAKQQCDKAVAVRPSGKYSKSAMPDKDCTSRSGEKWGSLLRPYQNKLY